MCLQNSGKGRRETRKKKSYETEYDAKSRRRTEHAQRLQYAKEHAIEQEHKYKKQLERKHNLAVIKILMGLFNKLDIERTGFVQRNLFMRELDHSDFLGCEHEELDKSRRA